MVIIGFGWFSNSKVYERDRRAFRDEIHASLVTELRSLREEINGWKGDLDVWKKDASSSFHSALATHSAKLLDIAKSQNAPVLEELQRLRLEHLGLERDFHRGRKSQIGTIDADVRMLKAAVFNNASLPYIVRDLISDIRAFGSLHTPHRVQILTALARFPESQTPPKHDLETALRSAPDA